MNSRSTTSNDRPAALALIAIVIIFIAVVGRGWQGLFSSYGLTTSIILGLIISVLGAILAYAIGAERAFQTNINTTAIAYFFFLFNISALGTVNAAFVTFQAGNIFREEIERASDAVIKLKDIDRKLLVSQDYVEYSQAIDARWKNLKAEIENPQRCGQGEEAIRRGSELQSLLPNFRMLSAGGQCNNIPRLVEAYEKQVADLIKSSPKHLKEKEKIDLQQKLTDETSKMLVDLAATSKSVNTRVTIQDIKDRLFENAEKYNILRQELSAVSKQKFENIPVRIDVSAVSALGDIGQVVPFVVSRISEPSTYIYLAIAASLDLAVIAAFMRIIRSGSTTHQRRQIKKIRQL